MANIIYKSPWYVRIFRSIGLIDRNPYAIEKQYQRVEEKPKAPKHGASWNNP